MLTPEGTEARRQRLWKALPATCDALVVSDPHHLIYLAGYAPAPYTFRTVGASAALVLLPGRATLVGDNLLRPFLDEAHVDEVVSPTWYAGTHTPAPRRDFLIRAVLEVLKPLRPRRIGIEGACMPSGLSEALRGLRPDVQFREIGTTLLDLRRVKDRDEIAVLRRSIQAGEAGMAAGLSQVRPGMTEFEAYRLIEEAAQAQAGERAFLYGDFVSGAGSHARLGPPTSRVLQRGELFLMDFSVVLQGYRGDFANTIVVGGDPAPDHRECFEGCMAALAVGESMLRPGTGCKAIDAAMRATLVDHMCDPQIPGHLGHGIGLDHPEPPYIVPESEDILVEGDVVTLEPGQYGDVFGSMRFERNYLITTNSHKLLSGHALSLGNPRTGAIPVVTPV